MKQIDTLYVSKYDDIGKAKLSSLVLNCQNLVQALLKTVKSETEKRKMSSKVRSKSMNISLLSKIQLTQVVSNTNNSSFLLKQTLI